MKQLMTCLMPLLLCLIANDVSAANIATARKLSGEALYRTADDSAYLQLVTGMPLAEGYWVRTGKKGWLELELSDGSAITLANNSEMELTKLPLNKETREGMLSLTKGKLRANVVKLTGKPANIRIKSGTAVAGVKGTEFLMMNAGPANIFFGNDGNVAVSGTDTKEKFLLSGTMIQTTRGFEPLEPLNVEPGTPLSEAKSAFNAVTGINPPADWLAGDAIADIIARWDVNYGHYLADKGSYHDALKVFQIAIDLAQSAEIRADAWLERGTVQGRFLDNPRAALAEFLLVLEEYPHLPQAEIALFSVGQTLYELRIYDQAASRLRQYLSSYPVGRYRTTAETLLKSIAAQNSSGINVQGCPIGFLKNPPFQII